MSKLLPLLSDGLRDTLDNILIKHSKCEIVQQLIEADDLIKGFNTIFRWDESDNPIKKLVLDKLNTLLTEKARMLSFRVNTFEISYLPEGKEPIYSGDGIWSKENRQTSKPARIIQKLLKTKFSCKEFEDFNNWLKAEIMSSGEFKLVTGTDITKYYDYNTYLKDIGTLGNSCMRYPSCSKYFKLYEDKASMLVVINDKNEILGRAIVWELPEGIFMDRVYVCYDYLEPQFIDYAESQKWYHRVDNSLLENGETQIWVGPKDNYQNELKLELTISLGDEHYEYFPYVDSFRYYNSENNTISTFPKGGRNALSNTDGSYDMGEIYVCSCGETSVGFYDEPPADWAWSEYCESWLCPDCAIYCYLIDDWISKDTEIVHIENSPPDHDFLPLDCAEDSSNYILFNNKWYKVDKNLK